MSKLLLNTDQYQVFQSSAKELKKSISRTIPKLRSLLQTCFNSKKDAYSLAGLLYWIIQVQSTHPRKLETNSNKKHRILAVCTLVPPPMQSEESTQNIQDKSTETPTWMIYNVCVKPELHGRGIGRILLEVVIRDWYSRKQPGDLLGLDVLVCNIPAVRLYLSLGFSPQKCYSDSSQLYYFMFKKT
jgi:ribosomal protein S18 acetylase RimI-like enzyme